MKCQCRFIYIVCSVNIVHGQRTVTLMNYVKKCRKEKKMEICHVKMANILFIRRSWGMIKHAHYYGERFCKKITTYRLSGFFEDANFCFFTRKLGVFILAGFNFSDHGSILICIGCNNFIFAGFNFRDLNTLANIAKLNHRKKPLIGYDL